MRKLKCPVYMQKRFKYIPRSVPFPKDKLVAEFGRCFTSTASFLVALAIVEGYKVIGLWGINPTGSDYARQRPALEYVLSVAHQRGIRLRFPKGVKFRITKRPKPFYTRVLYAYDWRSPGSMVAPAAAGQNVSHRARPHTAAPSVSVAGPGAWRCAAAGCCRVRAGRGRVDARLGKRPKFNKAAPTVLKKRRTRTVYRTVDPARRREVVIKRYDDWRESLSERDVMRSYGASRYLVRMFRWRKHQGRGYIVMEYVRGPTVNEMIARRGPLPPAKVTALALSILTGLDQLHRRRIVHGDLHGGNVIVTDFEKGKTKIIDLQHAVKLDSSGKARAKRLLSHPPVALAPESRLGLIDRSYDIYGVGFMCACMLAGKVPRTAGGLQTSLRTEPCLGVSSRPHCSPTHGGATRTPAT